MSTRWYREAVVYCLDVDTFQDSDGDGYGDLPGLISRLDYLERLGVTCLWLNPVHPSPNRDDGYDVADYYAIDPRLGSLGDFAELALEARQRGIRILLDLVVNHTSDQHPWFQASRSSPDSPYRDWYVWSEQEPTDRRQGIVFPGEQDETWTYDEQARAWYYHRFYGFQPDLNVAHPAVRAEIVKIMGFWVQLGASGFRIDAAPFVLQLTRPDEPDAVEDFTILDRWRQELSWRQGDAVLLCEANVEPSQLARYCGSSPDGPDDRAHMLFNFLLNAKLWLGLARGDAEVVGEEMRALPALPAQAQWATFLRNHDELDLSRLTAEQRADVFAAFAPQEQMRLYDRGIRRRLAPMLRGDRRHIELAYALQFASPGTPVLRYGEEIGMGEDLALPGRNAIRTPMQWDDGAGAGFSSAPAGQLARPVVSTGRYGHRRVNVQAQRPDRGSLLSWFERLIRATRECPEIGVGSWSLVDVPLPRAVLAHRYDAPEGTLLLLHNLADVAVTLDVGPLSGTRGRPYDVLSDSDYARPTERLRGLELAGWGYRWIRLAGRDIG